MVNYRPITLKRAIAGDLPESRDGIKKRASAPRSRDFIKLAVVCAIH